MRIQARIYAGSALCAGLMLGVTGAQAAGLTARAGLDQAQQVVAGWQADAALTSVGTTVLAEDGTAIMWQYSFLSPATSTCARVILLAGQAPRMQDLGACSPLPVVAADFVDSPAMLQAAVGGGFEPAEQSDANLVFTHDRAAPERECWVVHTIADFDPDKAVMRGWCVDPGTGRFVTRLSGENARPKP